MHQWAQTPFAVSDVAGTEFTVAVPESGAAPALAKRYTVGRDGMLEVQYTLRSGRARLGKLAVEINLGLHVPQADDRFIEVDGQPADPPHFAASARHARMERVAFVDRWADRRLDVWVDRKATLERAPIETVSLSEAGAERVFQGVEVRFGLAAALEPDRPWQVRFRLAPGRAESPA